MYPSSSDSDEDGGARAPGHHPAAPTAYAADRDGDVAHVNYESLRAVKEQARQGHAKPAAGAPATVAVASLHDLVDRYRDVLKGAQDSVQKDERELSRLSQDVTALELRRAKLDEELSVCMC